MPNKTKIVATLGPATSHSNTIKSLIDNGVDVFRLNFSHGSLAEHAKTLEMVNKVRGKHHHSTAVMGDLCGPKIRIGSINPDGQERQADEEVVILPNDISAFLKVR